jgi:hypothetical protein
MGRKRPFTVIIDDPEMTQTYEFIVEALDAEFAKSSAAVLALTCEAAKRNPHSVSAGAMAGFTASEDQIQAAKAWARVR